MEAVYQALVAVEPATLVVTILNLIVQLYIVKRFLLGKILKVLDQRRELVEREINAARDSRTQALATRDAYEKKLEQVQKTAEQIVDEAKHRASVHSQTIIREAQQQAGRIKEKALADIALEKKNAMATAKSEISCLALAVAGKVIARELDGAEQVRLADRFIAELGERV